MTTIIYINEKIPDYETFVSAVKVQICNFTNPITNNICRIGFVWENNRRNLPFGNTPFVFEQKNNNEIINTTSNLFTKELINYLSSITNNVVVDFISCSLNFSNLSFELKRLKDILPHVSFNYSVNLTGNLPQGDWIMESSGENISEIYFSDAIKNYKYTLFSA
jgi:hypothetical protein